MKITKTGQIRFKLCCPICKELHSSSKKPGFRVCAACKRKHDEKIAQECPTANDLEQGNMIARGENGD